MQVLWIRVLLSLHTKSVSKVRSDVSQTLVMSCTDLTMSVCPVGNCLEAEETRSAIAVAATRFLPREPRALIEVWLRPWVVLQTLGPLPAACGRSLCQRTALRQCSRSRIESRCVRHEQ